MFSVKFLVVATEMPSTNHSYEIFGATQPSVVVVPCNPKFDVFVNVTLVPKHDFSGPVKSNLGLGKICIGVIASTGVAVQPVICVAMRLGPIEL